MEEAALDRTAKPALSMILNEAEAQVGEAQEPAEVLLRHDLRLAGLVGVGRHVKERWVSKVVGEPVVACCGW